MDRRQRRDDELALGLAPTILVNGLGLDRPDSGCRVVAAARAQAARVPFLPRRPRGTPNSVWIAYSRFSFE
jgi:hypothetical protein